MGAAWAKHGSVYHWSGEYVTLPRVLWLAQDGKRVAQMELAPELMLDRDTINVTLNSHGVLELDQATQEMVDARRNARTAVAAFYQLPGNTVEKKYEEYLLRAGDG